MAIVDLGKDVLELANFLCHFNGQPKKSLAVAIFDPQRKRPSYAAAGTENVFSMAASRRLLLLMCENLQNERETKREKGIKPDAASASALLHRYPQNERTSVFGSCANFCVSPQRFRSHRRKVTNFVVGLGGGGSGIKGEICRKTPMGAMLFSFFRSGPLGVQNISFSPRLSLITKEIEEWQLVLQLRNLASCLSSRSTAHEGYEATSERREGGQNCTAILTIIYGLLYGLETRSL